jgi:hypothetical protein
MHAKTLVNTSPTHGTPRRFVRPMNFGAFPLRAIKSTVLDATYRELFPAEMTLITIKALMRWAAGRIPASSSDIVKGELAVFEVEPNSLSSFHGMSIPMKNMVPSDRLTAVHFLSQCLLTDIEYQNTPKYLSDGLWDCFRGVLRLSSCDADPISVLISVIPHQQ